MGKFWGQNEGRRQSDSQRATAHEQEMYQRRLIDELTDQSERLAAPMRNKFSYHLNARGRLISEYGDEVVPVLERGLERAERETLRRLDIAFEVQRRQLELDEALLLESLARGEIDATTLVVASPIPDAVRFGRTTIDGYDRTRLKTMIRIAHKNDSGVSIESLSLDQSNYKALQAMVEAMGHSLPSGLTSEQILAKRFWLKLQPQNQESLTDFLRDTYDASLADQLGGRWFAGRIFANETDALSFIKAQPHLIRNHMDAISQIMATVTDATARAQQLENARYNFAAALSDTLQGRTVQTLQDAGDNARAEGRTFDGDCATLDTPSQLVAQGFMQEWQSGTCRVCNKQTGVGGCFVCLDCEIAHTEGGDEALELIQKRVAEQSLNAVEVVEETGDTEPPRPVRSVGQFVLERRFSVGGETRVAVHALSGEELSEEETRVLIASAA